MKYSNVTNGEWVKTYLPEPIRSQWFHNVRYDEDNPDSEDFIDEMVDCPENVIGSAFSWSDTSEGHSYWSNIQQNINQYTKPTDAYEIY